MGISKTTLSSYLSKFRLVAERIHLKDLDDNKLGRRFNSAQIDESLYGHAKYNISKILMLPQFWCLGMIDVDSNRIAIFHIHDRSNDTMIPIIKSYVHEDTYITTDQCKSYESLEINKFPHLTVNHSTNFVNPKNGAHNQNIESSYSSCKGWLRKKHIRTRNLYQSYSNEWCFRHNDKYNYG